MDSHTQPTKRSRRFWIMVTIQALLVFGLLVSAISINFAITRYQNRNTELSQYRTRLNEIHFDLLTTQSSLRGFVATNESLLLNAYQEALPRIEAELQYLIDEANLQTERKETLNQLRIDIAQWQITYAEQAIAYMQQGNIAAAEELLAQSQSISNSLLERTEDLRLSLVMQSGELQRQTRILEILLLVSVIVLAILLLISTAILMRFWRKQNVLMVELKTISDDLLERNTALRSSIATQEQTNRRLNARIEEARLINQINEIISHTTDPQLLYPQLAVRIGQLLGGWCSILLEKDPPQSDELSWKGLFHPDPQKLELIRTYITQNPVLKTEGLHAPLFTENAPSVTMLQVPEAVRNPEDMDPELRPIAEAINLHSYMAMPIQSHKRPIGMISIASSITDTFFDAEQELFLEQIADRISAWIERMQLLHLAEQRALELQISFDSIPDSILTYDPSGKVVRMNQTAHNMFQSLDQANHYQWRLSNGQPVPHDEYPHIRALRGEPVRDEEIIIVDVQERPIVHTVSAEPIIDGQGIISGAIVVARDITTRKELERLKDEFLANMSHELRTPLTAILGYSDLLLKRRTEPLTRWHTSKIEGIRTGGQRLLNLVNDLLDIAKLEAGQIDLEFRYHDINELIQAQYQLLKPQFVEKSIRFQRLLAEEVPPVQVDNERIHQVLLNLLSNALKFTPEQGTIIATTGFIEVTQSAIVWYTPPLELDIPLVELGKYVLVSIRDTGIGIDAEALPHLWDRFYQAEAGAARRFGGTGLGLSIVQQLITLHGGYIWAASAGENQGSTFTFLLPLSATTYTETLPTVEGPQILMIEDDQATANIFEHYLHEAGYNVIHASSKHEALKVAANVQPAAIILDIMLPDSNGWAILKELRLLPHLKHTPVIVATIRDRPPANQQAQYATYLVKPVAGESLVKVVKQLILDTTPEEGYILIVDDDPDMLELMQSTLEEHGYLIQTAPDGGLALDMLRTQKLPALMLLDLMMPIVDGFQLLARIRADERTAELPVLIVTARDLTTEELARLRRAAQGIQIKHTLNIDSLVAEVQRHVPIKEEAPNAGADDLAR